MKCSAFLATSLDGYIADEHGSIEWLEKLNQLVPAGEDCGYAAYSAQVDCLVMGRNTLEQVLQFPHWPYTGKPVFVLSSTMTALPCRAAEHAELLRGTPAEVVAVLAQRGFRHAYVDGGVTIRGFLAAGLLSEITITLVPAVLGGGRPLFGAESRELRFELVSSRSFAFGFVQNTYRVVPAAG